MSQQEYRISTDTAGNPVMASVIFIAAACIAVR